MIVTCMNSSVCVPPSDLSQEAGQTQTMQQSCTTIRRKDSKYSIRNIKILYIHIFLYASSLSLSYAFISSLITVKPWMHDIRKFQHNYHPKLNTHIAIIPDGNSRWANNNFQPVSSGHSKGAQRLISSIRHLYKIYPDVKCLTIYAFSAENWKRAKDEISQIWSVAELFLKKFEQEALENNIKICMIGDWDDERVPESLRRRLSDIKEKQEHEIDDSQRRTLTVALALNYGGQQDILSAVQKISNKHYDTKENNETLTISESMFRSHLSTGSLPNLDLVIRTGGERRISNFLLWELAYAELYFCDTLWPDFDETCLDDALKWYSTRERRFGGRTK